MTMALFCLTRKRHAEEARGAAGVRLPYEPEYADDGFIGGRIQDVLVCFREEIRLAEKYGVSYNLHEYSLHLLGGRISEAIFQGFKNSGFQFV